MACLPYLLSTYISNKIVVIKQFILFYTGNLYDLRKNRDKHYLAFICHRQYENPRLTGVKYELTETDIAFPCS